MRTLDQTLSKTLAAFVREIIRGASDQTASSLVAAVLLSFGVTAGALWWLDLSVEHLLTEPEVFTPPLDDYTAATARLVRLTRADPARQMVLLVSGSSVREALTSPKDLSNRLGAAGVDAEVHTIATGNQTLWESEALFEAAPRPVPGSLLIVGLGALRVVGMPFEREQTIDHPRFGIELPAMQRLGAQAGIEPDRFSPVVWLGAWRTFLVPRAWWMLRSKLFGPVPMWIHSYDGRKLLPSQYPEYGARFESVTDEEFVGALEQLNGMLSRAKLRGWRVVTVRTQIDDGWYGGRAGARMAELEERLWVHLASLGFEIWDLNEHVEITPAVMADWCHINDPKARERWTEALVAEVQRAMVTP